jgi:hypothetical protein
MDVVRKVPMQRNSIDQLKQSVDYYQIAGVVLHVQWLMSSTIDHKSHVISRLGTYPEQLLIA